MQTLSALVSARFPSTFSRAIEYLDLVTVHTNIYRMPGCGRSTTIESTAGARRQQGPRQDSASPSIARDVVLSRMKSREKFGNSRVSAEERLPPGTSSYLFRACRLKRKKTQVYH